MAKKIFLIVFLSLLFFTTSALAYHQNPNLNWGNTNIIDAMMPPPGFYLSNYIVWYHSDEFKDDNGDNLPMDNELNVLVYCPQLIWISKAKLPANLRFGVQALLPIQNYDINSDLGLTAANNTIGDLCVGPFIGSAIPLAKDFVFHWFFEFDTYFPIGEYDKEYTLNPSANFWTFEPFLSITLQMPYGFTFSTRQHLTFNTTNDDFMTPDGRTHDLEPGMLYHFNYSLMKTLDFISPMLRFGVVGYYGKQIDEDQIDDKDWDSVFGTSSEEEVFAIGPALHYIHKGMVFSLKTYFESSTENRPEGERVVLRIILPF